MKNSDQLTEAYNYELPQHFIASRPAQRRDKSKLLVFNAQTSQIIHTSFDQISEYLDSSHLLVLNQSKVFPCRLYGNKESGGKVELFLLSLIKRGEFYPCLIRSNGKKKIGEKYYFFGELEATIQERTVEGDFLVEFNLSHENLLLFLERKAQIPIPPYIRDGIADEKDIEDYQTVYAKEVGSVAAPTAGLHFTTEVFESLKKKGVKKAFVTLHVGAGTFKTVSSENILDHKMHLEYFQVDSQNLSLLNQEKNIIAVGTTTLRVLESIYRDGKYQFDSESMGATDIFLYPGKEVRSIKGLLTNFHLPKSTLLMLVSSIIGREKTLELYEEAKSKDYRFFSYGDAMLILR